MEGEEAAGMPNDGEKPFFAITSEDVAQASEGSESTSVESPQSGEVEDKPSTNERSGQPVGCADAGKKIGEDLSRFVNPPHKRRDLAAVDDVER